LVAVCSERADRWTGSNSATSLYRETKPSGRTTVAAQQTAEALANGQLKNGSVGRLVLFDAGWCVKT
jgi:hypothetical protein